MLLDDAKSILREAGIETVEHEGTLVLMVEERGNEVIIYVMAEEERGIVYILASANPPLSLKVSALDFLKISWELVDRGIPCKLCLNEDVVVVEQDIDACHLSRESLLEGIYFTVESMLYLIDRIGGGAAEGRAEV